MATLTIADLDNGKRDLQTVDEVANSRAATATTRYGQQTTTLYESIRRINATGDEILANLGYFVPADYAPGLNVTEPNFTVVGPDGNIYAAQAGQLPFTTGAWDAAQWYPIQNLLNQKNLLVFDTYAQASAAAATLPDGQEVVAPDESGVHTRWSVQSGALSEVAKIGLDVTNFGARTSNTSAQNVAAFLNAEAAAGTDPIYVPDGTWRLTTPYDLGLKGQYYGPGILKFDVAEHKRRGGSSGSVSTPERYTLFYQYDSPSDVSVLFDGVAQAITFVNDSTVEAPGSLSTTAVVISIANGKLPLGPTPLSLVASNVLTAGASDIAPYAPPDSGWFGTGNTALGSRALYNSTTATNNTAVGDKALLSAKTGLNNTAVGFQSLYRIESASDNTAVGSIAGEWLTTGQKNTLVGGAAGGRLVTANDNVAIGWSALSDTKAASLNVAIGLRALGNTGQNDPVESVAIGAFSGSFAWGTKNTFVGYRSGCGPNSGSDGAENTFVGFFAGRNHNGADRNTGLGTAALANMISGNNNVAVGVGAAENYNGSDVVAVGYRAGNANISGVRNTAVGSVALEKCTVADATAVGFAALGLLTTGTENTAVGSYSGQALTIGTGNTFAGRSAGASTTSAGFNAHYGRSAGQYLTTGNDNTCLGAGAGRLSQDGSNAVTWSGSTCVGANSRVSANNQVQLGASGSTTYAYGAVQDRSDARDKADVRETVLGLDFIKELRAVDFKWDMRDDYVVTHEDGSVEVLPKDGSKKRSRYHHGLIAQQVREVMESHGVDFGGLQDHSVNGGCDVLSIGYTELIGPLIKAVQELSAKCEELQRRAEVGGM